MFVSIEGIVWKKSDPHVFYSSSKDGMLYQHIFKDANRPADKVVPSGLDMNLSGNVLHSHGSKSSQSELYYTFRDRSIFIGGVETGANGDRTHIFFCSYNHRT